MHSAPRVCWTKASLSEWVFAVVGAGRNMLSQPEALTVVPNSGGVFGLIGARSSPQPVALEGPIAPVRSVVMFVLAIAGIVNKNITRRKNAFVLGVETSSATKSKCGLCMEVQALVFFWVLVEPRYFLQTRVFCLLGVFHLRRLLAMLHGNVVL